MVKSQKKTSMTIAKTEFVRFFQTHTLTQSAILSDPESYLATVDKVITLFSTLNQESYKELDHLTLHECQKSIIDSISLLSNAAPDILYLLKSKRSGISPRFERNLESACNALENKKCDLIEYLESRKH